jgi:hypothetical protein
MTKIQRYSGRKLDENNAIHSLEKKGAVIFSGRIKSIDLKYAKGLGNKSFGLIDFLRNHCGYLVSFKDYSLKNKKEKLA